MTISSSSSSAGRLWRLPAWLLIGSLSALLAIAGCSDDGGGGGNEACDDEGPPTSTSVPDAVLKRASLLVEQRSQYTADGSKTDSTIVNLSLLDFSTYDVDSRFPTPCCAAMACYQLTGAPVTGCRGTAGGPCGAATCANNETCVQDKCVLCEPQPLLADKVTLAGAGFAPGSTDLEDKGGGKFLKAGLPAPLFATGPIDVTLTGRGDAGYFVSGSVSVDAPAPLVLLSPDPTQTAAAVSGTDMPIKWTAGNGELIELTMKSAVPGVTDKIVCIARDDGCATVPIGAIEWVKLDMKAGEQIALTVRRVSAAYSEAGAGMGMLVKASSRIDMLLEQ
jgi:hypothetical protein